MSGGTVRFGYNSNIVILDEDVTTNKLITITVQMDASIGTKVYVNENLVGEIKNEETAIAPSEIFWIGKSFDYTDRYFEGQINHFMIYDRLLTEEEIAYNYRIDEKRYNTVNETDYIADGLIVHYDAINNTGNGHSDTTTTWKDLSGNGNDITLFNFDQTTSSGWTENALNFDGINDYAQRKNPLYNNGTITDNITIEVVSVKNIVSYATVLSFDTSVNTRGHLSLWTAVEENRNYEVEYYFNEWGTQNEINKMYSIPITVYPINTVKTLTYGKNQNQYFTYLDGEKIDEQTITNIGNWFTDNLWLGRNETEGFLFDGKIMSVRIYNQTLSDAEIKHNQKVDKGRYNSVNETDYVTEGLIAHYDVINNTGNGYSNTTNTWKDLSGNGNDATLIGLDTTSGWQENYIKFDGIDDYALSNNNLGLSGDTALTMCAVAEWDADNWMSGYPSYMGNTSYSSYSGLSMTMYDGRPALDFWNYRYIANTPLSTKTIYQICLTKEPRSY